MRIIAILLLFFLLPLTANPFSIPFEAKTDMTEEDFLLVQRQLGEIDLTVALEEIYPKRSLLSFLLKPAIASKEDFKGRISKGLRQILIDPSQGKFPEKNLVRINQGGDRCIVCYATFNGVYPDLIKELPEHLEKTGFNGYLFYQIGGFPNPTGREIRYAGVPYAFKIFALLEAQKLGFQKVLWIDSVFIPLRDPTPLFQQIERTGFCLKLHKSFPKFLLPATRDFLRTKTGVDVLNARYVSAQVIGFDLNTPPAQEFIRAYYELVEDGRGFFSCFPEEYVYSALLGKILEERPYESLPNLVFSEVKFPQKTPETARGEGYFFLQKAH